MTLQDLKDIVDIFCEDCDNPRKCNIVVNIPGDTEKHTISFAGNVNHGEKIIFIVV